jgi:hypothetical protein
MAGHSIARRVYSVYDDYWLLAIFYRADGNDVGGFRLLHAESLVPPNPCGSPSATPARCASSPQDTVSHIGSSPRA